MSETTEAVAVLTGDYSIDPARGRIGFARHVAVGKVRGSLTRFEGKATINRRDFVASISRWRPVAS